MTYGIIYKATNTLNDKVYIGQTTVTLSKRKAAHKRAALLDNSVHWFAMAIRKYGWENFLWEIIARAFSKDELNNLEIYYISKLDSFGNGGYNMNQGGNGVSEIMKQRNSQAHKGKKASEETRALMQASHLKRHQDPIFKLQHQQSCSDRWANDIVTRERFRERMRGKNNPQYGKRGSSGVNAKPHFIMTPYGENFVVPCLVEFCNEWDQDTLNPKNLNMVAMGKRSHHKGYKCFHVEERATTIPEGSRAKRPEAVGVCSTDDDMVLSV